VWQSFRATLASDGAVVELGVTAVS
jgi:hypothetical protein